VSSLQMLLNEKSVSSSSILFSVEPVDHELIT